jgi:putative lipoic acid-binding regulatory protein
VDTTVKTQLRSLTLDVARLNKENQQLTEESKGLKRQVVQLTNVIDTDLTSDLKMKILATGDYNEADLEDLKVEQLQTIHEILSKAKVKGDTVYKPIRVGAATPARGTIGNLFGKTRKEILEMGGEF